MPNAHKQPSRSDQPAIYHIRIRGHLGHQWSDWFEGMQITPDDNGETVLTGPVVDQAALFGLLRKIRDSGIPLISLMRINDHQEDESEESSS